MKFLKAGDLEDKFRAHLKKATHVYIAVAWATEACPVIEDIEERVKNKNFNCLQFVVGLSGTITTPSLLEKFQKNIKCTLREGVAKMTFHPKVYIFQYKSGEVWSWVGSANLTSWAFNPQRNEEVICEFEDRSGESIKWFNNIFKNSNQLDDEMKSNYERRYNARPNKPPPEEYKKLNSNRPANTASSRKKIDADNLDHPRSLMVNGLNWDEFMEYIRIADKLWRNRSGEKFSVFHEEKSWINIINYVQKNDIMKKSNDWSEVDKIKGVLGGAGKYALFGTVFRQLTPVLKDPRKRKNLKRALNEFILPSQENNINAAVETLKKMRDIDGVGIAIATRLLTLARPDIAVSVNGRFSLNQWNYYRDNLDNPDNYGELLKWVHEQPWHGGLEASEPKNLSAFDKKIWSMRTALIDVFAYEGSG